MIKLRGYLAAAAVAAAFITTTQTASAATCGHPIAFTVNSSGAEQCVATGNTAFSGNDIITIGGYQYTKLDYDAQGNNNEGPLRLDLAERWWELDVFKIIDQAFFDRYLIVLAGVVDCISPDWAAFLLPTNVLKGDYRIENGYSITGVYLYGKGTVAVPGPVAGAGIPALLGLGGLLWARRRKATAAAA
jgi:hypothetical protein